MLNAEALCHVIMTSSMMMMNDGIYFSKNYLHLSIIIL